MTYSADNVPNPFEGLSGQQTGKNSVASISAGRTIRRQDLASAHEYFQLFGNLAPEEIPGATAISVSTEVLNDLKTKGSSSFAYQQGGLKGLLGGVLGMMNSQQGEDNSKSSSDGLLAKVHCTLERVGRADSAFPVLMNDDPVQLPAVHATCNSQDEKADFYFLDDPQNPLALAWSVNNGGDNLQVVKIAFPRQLSGAGGGGSNPKTGGGGSAGNAGGGGGSNEIEQKLSTERKVEIYGIYFDFASDLIRPQSEPMLREIADALQANPTWKLSVNGHTDNIGGDAYNQDLSERRAAAVKSALVERYHISPDRLSTQGFGASQPVESNDTIEGRARNRRVELVRL